MVDEAGEGWAAWPIVGPGPVVAVAGTLFAAVFALRLATEGSESAVSMLYVLPIALLAVRFGKVGGIAGAAIGMTLFSLWAVADSQNHVGALGFVTRGTAMFLLGGLVGDATERMAAADRRAWRDRRRRLELETSQRRQQEALEINDSVVQGIVTAKWLIEAGEVDRAVALLTGTIESSQELVAELLPPQVGQGSLSR